MDALQPAQIAFPAHVKKLLIVNRTKFEKNRAVNIIEGVLTGEMPGEDKANVQELMTVMQQTLAQSPRFEIVLATEVLGGNSVTASFPSSLEWSKIEELCNQYQADAVLAIEVYDSDFIVTNGKRLVDKKVDNNGSSKTIKVDEYYAEGVANVKVGFKVYNPKGRSIIDQQLFSRSNTWQGVGSTATDAALNLIGKVQATKQVTKTAGISYAHKIAAMPIKIKRAFYAKGRAAEIATGKRQADVNDWQGAIETWEAGVANASNKDAGKLCYNIAVAYEVLGDLPKAKEWVSKAYVDYGNKKARSYASTLDRRVQSDQRVNEQLK